MIKNIGKTFKETKKGVQRVYVKVGACSTKFNLDVHLFQWPINPNCKEGSGETKSALDPLAIVSYVGLSNFESIAFSNAYEVFFLVYG